ncbi:hypothetical protein Tco_0676274 [Tanacetum coccineum]
MAFVSTTGNINEANTVNVQVSTTNSLVSTVGIPDSTANLSDATIYAFMANQPNGSQLSKMVFPKDLGPRNQESRPRNQDSSRRTVNVEDTSSKDMVAIDGAGFDWSFMAEEEVTTNMALMAFLDSKFNKYEFNLATYKRGLAFVEEQLIFYKKNEVMFCDQIAVLKRDVLFKDSKINALKIEIEKLKNEKESNQIKINYFENASKSLDKLIGSQISNNGRKGVVYNAVPPPLTGLFTPSIIDLSYSGLEDFQQPEFKGYGPKASKSVYVDTSNEVKKTFDTPLVEELVSEKEKQTVFPKQQDKTARKPVKSFDHVQAYCKYHRRERMVYGNNYKRVNYNYTTNRAHPNAQRNMVPRAILMKTGLKPFNIVRTVNTAHPKSIVKVNTVRPKAVNTARPNSAVVNTVRANQANAVKALTCWGNLLTDDQGYVDSGCSRHMTNNISYLSGFQEFDGGYVTFGGGVRGDSESTVWVASSSKSLVYVGDIIFGSTKKELCLEFEKLMHDKFQMSSMGELTFFLDGFSESAVAHPLGNMQR